MTKSELRELEELLVGVEDIKNIKNHTEIMNNDLVREIVYEDDEIIAYADALVGYINYEKPVDLYIIHKKGIESFHSTLTLNKLNN